MTSRILISTLAQRAGLALAAVSLIVPTALAQVTVEGDAYPASFPQADIDIGITAQTVNVNQLSTAEQENYERGQNMVIGSTSYGEVRVLGGADLRWQHLVLGGAVDTTSLDPADELTLIDFESDGVKVNAPLEGSTSGYGVLRLEGFGSSFSNHVQIVPTQFQDIYPFLPGPATGSDPEDTYFDTAETVGVDIDFDLTPDFNLDTTRDTGIGFDAVVGLTGSGALYINTGAFMQVEDAFIAGYGPNATGYVEVDGVGSYLGVYGGLRPNATTVVRDTYTDQNDTIHQMIIGAYGDAEMRITNGARVDAFNGAAIGVTQSDGDDRITEMEFDDIDDPQGSGRVIVAGSGSTWSVWLNAFANEDVDADNVLDLDNDGGALAIGEFDFPDPSGEYEDEELGQGYLSIRSGGQVNVQRYIETDASATANTDGEADVKIGRMGTLDLRGGTLTVTDRVISDGLIQAVEFGENSQGSLVEGGGTIEAASFENSARGTVRVGAGHALTIIANLPQGELEDDASEPLVAGNMGLIELTGDQANGRAEFNFVRPADPTMPELMPGATRSGAPHSDLFYNAGEVAGVRGQIIANESTLRFEDGLWNAGDIAFTGGQNTVIGPVVNSNNTGTAATATGSISITSQANVVFEDVMINDGILTVSDDSTASFLGRGSDGVSSDVSYHGQGTLALVSTGDTYVAGDFNLGDVANDIGGHLVLMVEEFATDGFSHLVVQGDADFSFSTTAEIEILGNVTTPLTAGDVIDLVTVLGTPDFSSINVTAVPMMSTAGLMFQVLPTSNSLSLQVIPEVVINTVAGDYNNDGIVDARDYAVWREAVAMGAVFGDLPNDPGLVGGLIGSSQLEVWRDNYGATHPAPLASAPAPEPSALALLALAGLAASRRRR